jgi:hypothetical protein
MSDLCPFGPEWEKLKAGIKEKKPNLSDDDVETWAFVAFDEHGNIPENKGAIPTTEKAFDILFPKEKNIVKKGLKKVFNDFKKNIKRGFEEGLLAGQMAQGREMQKQVTKLETQLKEGKINEQEYKDKIKELKYEGRFKEAEGKLAGEIEGKKAGRKEGRAEERSFQKEFSARVTDYLDELVGKGKIDNVQARAIANKAGKVGTSEAGFKRFSDYVDKVVERADYANEMSDIKNMQKAANSKKSPLSPQIKSFTSINPENLPLEMLTQYKQALDLLTGKVPNPKLMIEMSADIERIKAASKADKVFDSVKTAEQAGDLLNDIHNNKVETIEDYVKIIGDTNKLKRRINQLLETEDISQEDYDDISSSVAFEQSKFEEKYKDEIAKIKDDFIGDIKENKIEPDYDFSPEEKELIEEINNLSDEDLKKLSVEDLYVLNEAKGVANDGYVDVAKLYDVVTSLEAKNSTGIADELSGLKETTVSAAAKKIAKTDTTYWTSRLGIAAKKIGNEFWLRLISPFNKGLSDYTKDSKDFGKTVADIFKANKIKSEDSHKMGMIIHYLQEYSKKFDEKYNNIKDVGTVDEFGFKLSDKDYTRSIPGKISDFKRKLGIKDTETRMKSAYESIPKGADGKVDLEDVYNDFMNGGGKYLTKEQRSAIDAVTDLFEKNVTSKQEYANHLRGKSLEKLLFYMPRFYYKDAVIPSAASEVGKSPLRIASPSGKERTIKDIMKSDLPMTDFGFLMNKAAKNTFEDYHLTKMLSQTRKIINANLELLRPENKDVLIATEQELGERLKTQLQGVKSDEGQKFVDKLLSATSVKIFFDPIRALKEATVGFLTYPIRGKTGFKGYAEIFKGNELSDAVKEFTKSPIRIKENINANFDIDTGKVTTGHGWLQEGAKWLSGFTEAHFNNMIWMPTFRDSFFEITGQRFDGNKFTNEPSYRTKFKRALNDAGSIADMETEEIIGTTTTGARRRTVAVPFGQIEASSTIGKIVGFVGGYTNREYESFIRGMKDFKNRAIQGDIGAAGELSKPLGIMIGITTMGYLNNATAYLQQLAIAKSLGKDDSSADYYKKQLMSKFDKKGAVQEIIANVGQLAFSQYGSLGRAMADGLATASYYAAKSNWANKVFTPQENIEIMNWSENIMNNITYHKVPKLETKRGSAVSKVTSQKEIDHLLLQNVSALSEISSSVVDLVGGLEAAGELLTKNPNEIPNKQRDAYLALKTSISTLQFALMFNGYAIPMQNLAEKVVNTALQEDKKQNKDGKKSF